MPGAAVVAVAVAVASPAGEAAAGVRTEAVGAARPINASAPDTIIFRIATSHSWAHQSPVPWG